ncbi:MAG: tRNA (adenosine(37)-N6)-dimethylallyltransferase MiaA [Gammaproteobacteria bacterium]
MQEYPPVLYLMGPTASGKTDLAIELNQHYPFEIISVDSAMVYRGMDIGTAKPTADILRLAPHRLIDIRDPWQAYSAAEFRSDALREIADIRQRGRIPLLVGGTMLYFRALQQGLSPLPAASPEVRARLEEERTTCGNAAMHARLSKVDPQAASRIHPNDPQRVQRALEVFELTGSPLSELQTRSAVEKLPVQPLKMALLPPDRTWLHQRIEQRFEAMLAGGLIEEVATLKANADLSLDQPAMRAVGYRQVWRFLDGEINYATLVQQGISATRQFAKRQLTWLRSENDLIRLDCTSPKLYQDVINYLHEKHFFRT